ncbi:hypothetical protein C8R48DRAFT_600320, partial [Suillus tomentosus]
CLHIFLISVDDYKAVSLKVLFSNSLIPSLHKDLRIKINENLSIDIDAIECGIHGDVDVDQDFEPAPVTDVEDPLDEDQQMHDMENTDGSGNGGSQQEDEDENARDEGAEDEYQAKEDPSVAGEENSGF